MLLNMFTDFCVCGSFLYQHDVANISLQIIMEDSAMHNSVAYNRQKKSSVKQQNYSS